MADAAPLAPWVRRFLLEHLVGERNLSRNTQRSYRDSLRLVLPFVARHTRTAIDQLQVEHLSPDHVRAFLQDLEAQRGCGAATRNQRLAAIRSLAQFIALRSPEHIRWCGEIRTIPFKKAPRPLVTYLEKPQMDALLAAATPKTNQGLRDHALLLFLYNTGARADEAAHVLIGDLQLALTPGRDVSSVLIRGKGNKLRRCPLWESTVDEVTRLIQGRRPEEHVFINRRGQPLTRFGVHAMVKRYAARIALTLGGKRVSPHTIRHTTATHLLRSGVDINTIRAWLGHVSLTTTNVYAEVDLEMKAKALATCTIEDRAPHRRKPWREDRDLMRFLQTL
jgi:site-specific recombinase XerD